MTEKTANDRPARAMEVVEAISEDIVIWYTENMVTGKWNKTNTRTRFPYKILPWKDPSPFPTFHQRRGGLTPVEDSPNREGDRGSMSGPFKDLLSSPVVALLDSLLVKAGLRVPGIARLLDGLRVRPMKPPMESIA